MSRQYWSELAFWNVADGTAIASSTTETIVIPNITLPANMMSDGRAFRFTGAGRLSTPGTPPVRFRLRWGGVSGTVFWDSGTITCGSGVTASEWWLQVIAQVRSNGSSGTIFAMGPTIIGSAL